jgi:Putative peptidoglycan binding domain
MKFAKRLVVMGIAAALCARPSSTLAQDVQPEQIIGPVINLMGQAIEAARIRNSPEFINQQPQPGGLTRGQVIIVQQLLLQKGYDVGQPDGVVGPKTMAVVAQLQLKAGVPATGLPDQQLFEALLQGQ